MEAHLPWFRPATVLVPLSAAAKVIYTKAHTFDCTPAATAWMKKREGGLQPGALDRRAADDPPLADVIDRYINESKKRQAAPSNMVQPYRAN
jgi:hypothetical protein